jgi:hypothetical protein
MSRYFLSTLIFVPDFAGNLPCRSAPVDRV